MQTPPRTRYSSKRIPTPQISERKKCLFENKSNDNIEKSISLEQQSSLDGIRPLSPDLSSINNLTEINLNKSVRIMLKKLTPAKLSFLKHDESIDVNMFTKYTEAEQKTPTRRSLRTVTEIKNTDIEMISPKIDRNFTKTLNTPENKISSPTTPKNSRNCTDELGKLFKNSLNFKNDKKKIRKVMDSDESFQMSSTDDEDELQIEETPCKKIPSIKKRIHLEDDKNYESKKIKLNENVNQSLDNIQISTKTFYSNKENLLTNNNSMLSSRFLNNSTPRRNRNRIKRKSEKRLFNKGVHHNIKKPIKPKNISIDDMLKTIRCDKLKYLPSHRMSKYKIDLVHKILSTNKNPIEMAKPLNINVDSINENNINFSDIESGSETDSDNNINRSFSNTIEEETNLNANKKFFKSARNSTAKKEITITNQIKITFSNGKIELKKKKKRKSKMKVLDQSFSAEQIQINEIIENLNRSPVKNYPNQKKNEINENNFNINEISSHALVDSERPKDYTEFLNRIPYNTTDPALIEQQRLLLNFLITNDICNEKNFDIFIANPDNHKEEANRICNSLVLLVDSTELIESNDEFDSFRNRIPFQTDDPFKIEEQNLLLDFLIENQLCTEENFKIFITEPEIHKEKAEKIINSLISIVENNEYSMNNDKENEKQDANKQIDCLMETETIVVTEKDQQIEISNKQKLFPIFHSGRKIQQIQQKPSRYISKSGLWRGAVGSNQYQIDAGQKEYGAKQCPQCGLVYTVHEPEEEILHNEYHNSMHILKFRSWIDEDVIANYPEWGQDGRIIKLKSSSPIKKRQRLMDVLKIVDKELGFSSYILPTDFVAFLAIRKQQIVGLCLIQFLNTANRYISVNGVDCCTEELFEARCGISRIWISPLHRRLHIATKLILAVQSHTIIGEFIDLDKIAFSSPTEDGRKFAQKITNRNDFLIYQ